MTICKSLKCWYTNADSLSNKFNELKSRLATDKPDIVAVTEVNCKFDINTVCVFLLTQTCVLFKMIF